MEDLFKALGDQNRLKVLNLLRTGRLCVCEIEKILDTTQSNTSRHLSKLKSMGIISFEKKAQWVHYYINPQFIENNKILYQYICEKMDQDIKFSVDVEKLKKMRELC